MKWINKITKYIDTEAIRGNIKVKHVNKTSLIRSSPNALGLRVLVHPFSGALSIMFSRKVFTTVSLIRDSLKKMKSVGMECTDSPY